MVNDVNIMKLSASNTENDVNTAQCTTDFDAPNPCVEANPCKNNGECSVVAADNSGMSVCLSVCLFVCRPVCLSACLVVSVYLQ